MVRPRITQWLESKPGGGGGGGGGALKYASDVQVPTG